MSAGLMRRGMQCLVSSAALLLLAACGGGESQDLTPMQPQATQARDDL